MTPVEIAHLHEIANSLEAERVYYAKLRSTSIALVRAYLMRPRFDKQDPSRLQGIDLYKPFVKELENLHTVLTEYDDLKEPT